MSVGGSANARLPYLADPFVDKPAVRFAKRAKPGVIQTRVARPADERHSLLKFDELGLTEPLIHAIARVGYSHPTPIQAEVVPAMLAGHDVLGIAQTGTGKTAAFVLPILNKILGEPRKPAPGAPRALILAPTRELAGQIAAEINRYSDRRRVRVVVIVGGVKPGPQVRALVHGADIVVATPGRLLDHMGGNAVRLDRVEIAVLDEADQMLDLGFLPAMKQIVAALPKTRQTAMMSATMPDPIAKLARAWLREPKEVSVSPASRPIEEIAQSVVMVDSDRKRDVLTKILGTPDVTRAIVFTRTKRGADKVQKHLADAGLGAAAIHGNKSQGQRERALAAFRGGSAPILVATDIAARGIHVDNVSHVVNYELPDVAEAYVHRIGRTARAGTTGTAISLCDPSERKLLRAIERLTGSSLDPNGSAPLPAESRERDGGRGRRPSGGNGGRPRFNQQRGRPSSRSGRPERTAAV